MSDLREELKQMIRMFREEGVQSQAWKSDADVEDVFALLSKHGVVQLDENQDFAPFAGIPLNFNRVHPLERQGGREHDITE